MRYINFLARKAQNRLRIVLRRFSRIRRISTSFYRNLLLDEPLELEFLRHAPPPLHKLSEDDVWQHLQIQDFNFFWPKDYEVSPLAWIYQEVFSPARWNPHAYEFGAIAIRPEDWVVDAGACEGFFTHYALMRGARVLVIEPVPVLAQALARTFEAEIQSGRVRILWGAIGDQPGELKLRVSQDALYISALDPGGDTLVPVYTLDSLLERQIVPAINFVKMDIEGQEVVAIRGATNILRTLIPRLSIAVYHQEENAREILNYLQDVQPLYHVRWRGVWARGDDLPRPYMLHAV